MTDKNEGWAQQFIEQTEWTTFRPLEEPGEIVYSTGAAPDWDLIFTALGVLVATIPVIAWLWKIRPRRKLRGKDPLKHEKARDEGSRVYKAPKKPKAPKKAKPPKVAPVGRQDSFVGICGDAPIAEGVEVKITSGPPVPVREEYGGGLDPHEQHEAVMQTHERISTLSDEVVQAGGGWPKTWDGIHATITETMLTQKRSRELTTLEAHEAYRLQQEMQKVAPRRGTTNDGYKWQEVEETQR